MPDLITAEVVSYPLKLIKRKHKLTHKHAADKLLHCIVFTLYLGCQQVGVSYCQCTQPMQSY